MFVHIYTDLHHTHARRYYIYGPTVLKVQVYILHVDIYTCTVVSSIVIVAVR